jgi:hypothetical protein
MGFCVVDVVSCVCFVGRLLACGLENVSYIFALNEINGFHESICLDRIGVVMEQCVASDFTAEHSLGFVTACHSDKSQVTTFPLPML